MASVSFSVDQLTVIAFAALAGDVLQASIPSLPDATTTGTPMLTSSATKELVIRLRGPPRLIFTTAGPGINLISLMTISRAA
jgi:hypothetical protein